MNTHSSSSRPGDTLRHRMPGPTTPLVVVQLVVALAACGSEPSSPAGQAASGGEASTSPLAERDVALTPAAPTAGAEPCSLSTVLFAFDSAELDDAARNEIAGAVQCYRKRGAPANLRLSGATDPRGTEEYNLALGERRARAVANYLSGLGVAAERITVTSVGAEKAEGSDEDGWARDRKVSNEASQ